MIDEQEFLKWRCLVAMAHADGIVMHLEADMINQCIKDIALSEQQRTQLRVEMEHKQDIHALYASLHDEDQKRHLVQLAFDLFWSDYEFHKAEQEIFLMLRGDVVDLNG